MNKQGSKKRTGVTAVGSERRRDVDSARADRVVVVVVVVGCVVFVVACRFDVIVDVTAIVVEVGDAVVTIVTVTK